MEKYLKIGEQYVEWIAPGLGGLWLVLMGWLYVIRAPITQDMNHAALAPGEIDLQIVKDTQHLSTDIKDPTVWVQPKPVDAVAQLTGTFDRALAPMKLTPVTEYVKAGPVDTQPTILAPTIVRPPAPEVAAAEPSKGTSLLGVPQTQPAPAVAGGAAAAANANVQPVISPEDHDWDTNKWTVSVKALDAAFGAAHIPVLDGVYQTAFLRVELVREEMLANGQWGHAVIVPPIPTVTLDPMPSETAPTDPDKIAFRDAAAQRAQDILTPPFFSVIYGTKWYPPGTPKPDDVFAPAGAPVPVPVVPGAVPPRIGPRPGIAPGPGGVGQRVLPHPGEGGFAPRTPYGAPYRPGVANPNGELPRRFPGVVAPQAGIAAQAGFIDPRTATDVTIYTHDWTVEPGHSYRYKICYWISNPLLGLRQINVKQADQDLLAIKSDFSKWTDKIEIPSRFRFFAQKLQKTNGEITFDLFARKPGAPAGLERSVVRATPGDTIGASPWMLVDVRQDSTRRYEVYFLVADPSGRIERHDFEKDKQDPDHLDLLDKVGAAAAANAGG